MQQTTLCLLIRNNSICLAEKKRGFGIGKLNAPGGKADACETIEAAAVRELQEEVGVSAATENLEKVGMVYFYFDTHPDWDQEMHVFIVRKFSNEPTESDEMRPRWYPLTDIPYRQMWVTDQHWLPPVLQGKRIWASFHFTDAGETLGTFEVRTL